MLILKKYNKKNESRIITLEKETEKMKIHACIRTRVRTIPFCLHAYGRAEALILQG